MSSLSSKYLLSSFISSLSAYFHHSSYSLMRSSPTGANQVDEFSQTGILIIYFLSTNRATSTFPVLAESTKEKEERIGRGGEEEGED